MRLHHTKAVALVDDNFNAESDGLFKGYAAATGNVDLGGDKKSRQRMCLSIVMEQKCD